MEKTVTGRQQISKTGYPEDGGNEKRIKLLLKFLYYLFILFHLLQLAYDLIKV